MLMTAMSQIYSEETPHFDSHLKYVLGCIRNRRALARVAIAL